MNYTTAFLAYEIIYLLLKAINFNSVSIRVLLLVSFLSTSFILFLGRDYKLNKYKYIICLGHKLVNDQMDLDLINRLNKTIRYVKEDTTIILTGGITKGNALSEAHLMNAYLQKNNIKNTILLEDESKTTVENIENIVRKYPEITNENVLLVSSDYHLFRAKLICKRCGIKNIQAVGCDSLPITFIKQMIIEKYCLLTKKY